MRLPCPSEWLWSCASAWGRRDGTGPGTGPGSRAAACSGPVLRPLLPMPWFEEAAATRCGAPGSGYPGPGSCRAPRRRPGPGAVAAVRETSVVLGRHAGPGGPGPMMQTHSTAVGGASAGAPRPARAECVPYVPSGWMCALRRASGCIGAGGVPVSYDQQAIAVLYSPAARPPCRYHLGRRRLSASFLAAGCGLASESRLRAPRSANGAGGQSPAARTGPEGWTSESPVMWRLGLACGNSRVGHEVRECVPESS